MKVGIIGAGAMGTLYGMRLAMSGVNVFFGRKERNRDCQHPKAGAAHERH